ncbi:MAG: 6-bladed beta-propeller, partial [Balneolales bacterium]
MEPDQLTVHFEEEFVIGHDESTPDEYLADPLEIRTDQNGMIYIPDSYTSIKVYDAEGSFQHQIGRSGDGPGEFRRISAIEINGQNELITFDSNRRHITRFSDAGNVLETQLAERETMIWPEYSRQISENRYLLLRKSRETSEAGDEQLQFQSFVMHLFDITFENRIASFGHVDSLMDQSAEFASLYPQHFGAGHFWPGENGDIWYVPGLYDGRIFRFQENSGGWSMNQTIRGHVIPQQPVVDVDNGTEGSLIVNMYTSSDVISYRGKVHSESLGVFILNDGRLIHFSSQLDEGERRTLIEVFSSEGELEGVGGLEEFTFAGTEAGPLIGSFWKD